MDSFAAENPRSEKRMETEITEKKYKKGKVVPQLKQQEEE